MSPFYLNMLNEYVDAILEIQIEVLPEDVNVLTDLAKLYAVSEIVVEVKPLSRSNSH